MTTVCVVTGSRAEYGLLHWTMREVGEHPDLELRVAVTGSHLSPAHGRTVTAIEDDGFGIDARVECLVSSDTGAGAAKSVGLGTIGFADAFASMEPDGVVVLGDRFEILAAAQAAYLARAPLAHLCGGDVTEGALDEAMRHMITKMASFHFVSHREAARRVRQLGEDPDRIHDVGHPGLEWVRRLDPLSRSELEASIGFRLRERNLLVTFHPPTAEATPPLEQFDELAAALDGLGPDVGIVLTQPNADPGGAGLDAAVRSFAEERENAIRVDTLGQRRYLSLMAEVDAVVGNSSSGILEAPSLDVPTVNVGDRQKGRPRAASVLDCPPDREAIVAALERAFGMDCSDVTNPYGDGRTAGEVVGVLADELPKIGVPRKRFHDLEVPGG